MTVTLALEDLALDPGEWVATGPEQVTHAAGLWHQWMTDGYVIKRGIIDHATIDAYTAEWRTHNADRPGGWPDATPYMRHPALLDLCTHPAIANTIDQILGEPAGVHLNLTGWVTTGRDWHQDSYLNPPGVGGHYAAVWIALDDIHPDSGPFEIAPGTVAWPQVSQAKIRAALGDDGDTPQWPKHSERILTPLFTRMLEGRRIDRFVPAAKGDVLFWNGRALHRGAPANVPGMERRALIAHYSGIHHRADMPRARRHGAGWYFPLEGGPVR